MNQNNNVIYTEQQINELVDSRVDSKLSKHLKSTVWHNPVTRAFYEANDPSQKEPQYDRFICNSSTFGYGVNQLKGASAAGLTDTEVDNYRFNGISNEYLDQATNMWSDIDKLQKKLRIQGNVDNNDAALKGAGVITTQSYPALANVMVDTQVLELIARDFVLEQAVTKKSWDKLTYTGYNILPYQNEGDLGELDMIDGRELSYAPVTINMKKAQGHVAASKWADMSIRNRNVVQDNFSIINNDFPRIYAQEIATGLTGFANNAATGNYTTVGAGDFHSTYKPTTDFLVNSGTVRTAGGGTNTLAMNSTTFTAMSQNTWMRTGAVIFGAIPALTNMGSRTATHTLLPGYTIYIDELLPAGTIFQYDKAGTLFLEGPSRTSTVDDEFRWRVSQIVDHWYGFGIRASGFGVEITGTN